MNKKKIDQIKTFSSHFYDIISISQVSDLQILSGKRPNTRAAQDLMCCPHHRKDISYASYSPQTFIVIYCMPELWATRVFGYYQSYQFYRKKTLNCTGSHVLSPPQKRHLICFIQSSDVHSHLLYA